MTGPRMPWDDQAGQQLWDAVFHPEVIAGVIAAQEQHDAEVLGWLDDTLAPVTCDMANCEFEAVAAALCAHSSALVNLVCGAHRESLVKYPRRWRCRYCKHTGLTTQLIKWRPVFTRRSRA